MFRSLSAALILAALMGCTMFSQTPMTPEEELTQVLLDQRGVYPDFPLPAGTEVTIVAASPELVHIEFGQQLHRSPIRPETSERILEQLQPVVDDLFPDAEIRLTTERQDLDSLVPRAYGGVGPERNVEEELAAPSGPALVRPAERVGPAPTHGLEGRHIALWHSHGWYFDENANRWQWQRTRQYTSVEDMGPMSYTLPFIVPMLENAGAVALVPRERDLQLNEVVVDNVEAALGGGWSEDDSEGFEAGHAILPKNFNPHAEGTHHTVETVPLLSRMIAPRATYVPEIPEDGDYAVTVSYIADDSRATDARYIVNHAGGQTVVLVNQRMHGHGWIHLGTFTFRAGSDPDHGSVILDARSAEPGTTVSADAVRFGGGIGSVEVGGVTSGMPRYTEAAHYQLQYAGFPAEYTWLWDEDWNEYTQDYGSRAEWVNWLNGAPNGPNGARDLRGGQVPIDLSLAFHTDAGVTDGIIGSLAIYRSVGEEGRRDTEFPDGRPRWLNRELADMLQTQIMDDVHAMWGEDWTRRDLRDASYSECRRPNVPSLILELGAHQNFDDMTVMIDPAFRFVVSRAIYKSMLRFIAVENGFDPIVQPLPPTAFGVEAVGPGEFTLTWAPQHDPLEPTAEPTGYLVYHREGGPIGWRWNAVRGGGFGEPVFTEVPQITLSGLDPDAFHSFRITAVNDGGESFPSPTLAAAWGGEDAPEVLVVDAFDRVATPHQIDIEGEWETFDRSVDRGVGFGVNIGQIGEQVFNDPTVFWQGTTSLTNDFPGHGSTLGDMQAKIEMGNMFDHTALHVGPLTALGYTVHAVTDDALDARGWGISRPALVDWILGEEKTVLPPAWCADEGVRGPQFEALPMEHREMIADLLDGGGQLILSGSHWASDVVQPGERLLLASGEQFLNDVLGLRWQHWKGSSDGVLRLAAGSPFEGLENLHIEAGLGTGLSYAAESPDAIEGQAGTIDALRYEQTRFGACVINPGRSAAFGFPLESIADAAARQSLMEQAIRVINTPLEEDDD